MNYLRFIILSAFLMSKTYAQISFNATVLETNFRGYVATAISDMNNDYRDDIVRVGYYGDVSIATQNFDGSFLITDIGNVFYSGVDYGSWSICVADINGDNINDIFVGNNGDQFLFTSSDVLVYNTDKLEGLFFAQTANFIDIDEDGDLDLFVCNDDTTNTTYENDGSGNFSMVTNLMNQSNVYSGNYGSIWTDFDNDNDLDVYISKCKHGVTDSTDPRRINVLYRNDGGSYSDVASIFNLDDGSQSWCADFGDIDNDGDFDVIIANHAAFHRLYRNDGDTAYVKITASAGIDEYTDADVYQSIFSDLDNDGWLDLILTNEDNGKIIYQNDQDGTFTLLTNPIDSNKLFSVSLGDLNNDGFTDMYSIRENQVPNIYDDEILLNDANSNNFIGINVEENAFKYLVGAKIKIYGSWGVQTKEIRSGESYGIHNSFQKIFGLGTETDFDSLVVQNLENTKRCIFTSVPTLNERYVVDLAACSLTTIIDSTSHLASELEHVNWHVSDGQIVFDGLINEIVLTNLKGQLIPFTIHHRSNESVITPLSTDNIILLNIENQSYKIYIY